MQVLLQLPTLNPPQLQVRAASLVREIHQQAVPVLMLLKAALNPCPILVSAILVRTNLLDRC